jgi:protein phosphatase
MAGLDALLAVADGMGGHNAGRVASDMAVTFLCQRYSGRSGNEADMHIAADTRDEAEQLRSNIEQLNTEIHAHSLSDFKLNGMGTTLDAVLIAGNRLIVGHVGDSRVYLISSDEIKQLTEDHSWVAEQIRAGLLEPEEAATHPWRNVISRSVGNQPDVFVDISSIGITAGDTIILCSDGLSSMVSEQEILHMVTGDRLPQTICENLVNLANLRGGPDNITVVAARID